MIFRRFRSQAIPLVAVALLMWTLSGARTATAGPLHDPFIEKFQVGTWNNPEAVDLAGGYPAGLLEPAQLDSTWSKAVRTVLESGSQPANSSLTHLFLNHLQDDTWLGSARQALDDLEAGRVGAEDFLFLRAERLTRSFFRAVADGDQATAAELALDILGQSKAFGLDPREQLVWDLRHRLTRQLAQNPLPKDETLWPAMSELGPFDKGKAWVLWAAHRRAAGAPVLTPEGDQEELGSVLAGVGKGWFSAQELYASGLSNEWKAGLGGILLDSKDLPAHYKKYPKPPQGFSHQGRWVRGQRRLRKGHAGSYEQLAGRQGISPGWRMDVWRRASELRALKGAWVEGLTDLENALQLAGEGRGTKGLRRRLRQWTEQALVLCLAKDDLATARRIRKMGLAHFNDAERDAFVAEIRQWNAQLDRNGSAAEPLSNDSVDLARLLIGSGAAPIVRPVTAKAHAGFAAAADQDLWQIWYKWGVALADPAQVSGDRKTRAIAYREALLKGLEGDSDTKLLNSALAVVALRLGDRPWLPELLRQTTDVDAGRLCGWQTPPRPSLVPGLLPEVRGSELDRHALLGFCLAIGDMRGILGLAFELPGRGLTRDEKRLFLYPLPTDGPIREAILAGDNEPALLLAVARNESLFEPAVRSRAGALGWMQIMPFHYPQNGAVFGPGNWRIPAMSIKRGDGLLTENRRRYKGDPYRILAAYNAGPGAASRWDRQLGGDAEADIYLAWIGYPETRAYVEKVLIDREIYNAIIGAKKSVLNSGDETGTTNE